MQIKYIVVYYEKFFYIGISMDGTQQTIPPKRGAAPPFTDKTMPGRRDRVADGHFMVGNLVVNRYKVLAELGRGGMGIVYKCFDETAGIEVALKALPPELTHSHAEMEHIKENFRLVANLIHQNIAISKNLEYDSATGHYYLIMEYCEGENLQYWIMQKRKTRSLTLNNLLPILQQIAEALDYAHSEKIMHRDIKPGNIMINSRGKIKILDLGLAAQIHSSMTRVSMQHRDTSGTAPYMAPEQWRGRPQGAAADQYSFAVMTYEILAGHLPFECADTAVLREIVLNDTPDDIPGISNAAQAALKRALSKNPADRFDSCKDFVAALSGKNADPKILRNIKKLPYWTAAASLFGGLLVGCAGFYLFRSADDEVKPEPVRREPVRAVKKVETPKSKKAIAGTESAGKKTAAVKTVIPEKKKAAVPEKKVKKPVVAVPGKKVKKTVVAVPEKKKVVSTVAAAPVKKIAGTPKTPEKVSVSQNKKKTEDKAEKKETKKLPPAVKKEEPSSWDKMRGFLVGALTLANKAPEPETKKTPEPKKVSEKKKAPVKVKKVVKTKQPPKKPEKRNKVVKAKVKAAPAPVKKVEVKKGTLVIRLGGVSNDVLNYLNRIGLDIQIANNAWCKIKQFPYKQQVNAGSVRLHFKADGFQMIPQEIVEIRNRKVSEITIIPVPMPSRLVFSSNRKNAKFKYGEDGSSYSVNDTVAVESFKTYTITASAEGYPSQQKTIKIRIPDSENHVHINLLLPELDAKQIQLNKKYAEGLALYQKKEYEKALKILEECGKNGHADACYFVAKMCEDGKGMWLWLPNKRKAYQWYEKAAQNGHINAAYIVGNAISRDDFSGSRKDMYRYLKQAADGKSAEAAYRLAHIYESDPGADKKLVIRYLHQAARLKSSQAMYELGLRYENGRGVAVSIEKAIYWYKQAAKADVQEAQERLDVLDKNEN